MRWTIMGKNVAGEICSSRGSQREGGDGEGEREGGRGEGKRDSEQLGVVHPSRTFPPVIHFPKLGSILQ